MEILLGSVCHEKVCRVQPVSIQHSCTFVVDLNCIADPNDLRADDCGVWKHKGLRKTWVIVDEECKVVYQRREHPPSLRTDQPGHLYLLSRIYHALQSSEDFRRMIALLKGGWFL